MPEGFLAPVHASLQERVKMLDLLLHATPDVICFKDHLGRWLLANDAAIRLFRLETIDYKGQTDRDLALIDPFLAVALENCARTDESTWLLGTKCVHEEVVPQPGGEAVILETIKTPLFGPEGERHGILLVGRDITERRRMEGEVLRQTLALERAKELDRLKTEMVNTVSLDLRSPITAITGYAEFLADELAGSMPAEQLAYVRQIQLGTQRLKALVDDLLEFAQIEAGALDLSVGEANVGAVIQDVRDSLAAEALAKQITLETSVPADPLVLNCDGSRLAQVLLKLVGNSLKFTEAGGAIAIKARASLHEAQIEVVDTGGGILPEHLPYIFEKFYRADSSVTGTGSGAGLGLAIAKALVEAHGGVMGARSVPGKGSTFWFTLPLG